MRPLLLKDHTMNTKLRNIATAVAGVAVVTATVVQTVRAKKNSKTPVQEAVEAFYSPEFLAFNKAQAICSDRMLDGYYDDLSDAEYQRDFDVLYATFLTK
jgi:hypothetical protein